MTLTNSRNGFFGKALARTSAGILTAVLAAVSAQAGLLPEGADKLDLTTATASSNQLWYIPAGVLRTITVRDPAGGERFQDTEVGLKYARGLGSWDIGAGLNWVDKRHIASDKSIVKENSGLAYASAFVKKGMAPLGLVDWTPYFEAKVPFGIGSDWLFTSPNDRSLHLNFGAEASMPLPVLDGLSLFTDQRAIVRSHGRVAQYEGSLGVYWAVNQRISFAPFYHVLASLPGGNCNHSPRDLVDFHTRAFPGNLSDSHHGPGFSLGFSFDPDTFGFLPGVLGLEAFGYYKLAGVNTDQSFTVGVNLSYLRF